MFFFLLLLLRVNRNDSFHIQHIKKHTHFRIRPHMNLYRHWNSNKWRIGNHWIEWKKYVFTSVERNDSNLLFTEWPKRYTAQVLLFISAFRSQCECSAIAISTCAAAAAVASGLWYGCYFFVLLFTEDRVHFSFAVTVLFWLFISPLYLCHSNNFQSIYTVHRCCCQCCCCWCCFFLFFRYCQCINVVEVVRARTFIVRSNQNLHLHFTVNHDAKEPDRLTHSVAKIYRFVSILYNTIDENSNI